jgi:hypothetical protein
VADSIEIGDLALQAFAVLEEYAPGRAAIGDAMLLVEVQLLDGEGEQIATATHYFATTRRSVVQRGLVDDCIFDEDDE